MIDPAQIREALERYESPALNVDALNLAFHDTPTLDTLAQAAREYVAWLETGPDYEAARALYPDVCPECSGVEVIDQYVDAALRSQE